MRLRVILLTALVSLGAAGSAWSQPADKAPDTVAARVLACAACHGDQGQGTNDDYFPRLAGKPAGYLYNQLLAFKEHRRQYPPMNYLLEFLTDSYLHEIAEYFAAQRPPFPKPSPVIVSKEVLAHGKDIVTNGVPARDIPACINCHNPNLTGMEPAIPGLLGLHASYISAQLGGWRYGTRTAKAPDCMQIVAGHLTEADVTAVAAYLASLPAPIDPAQVARGTLPMPLECGSEPLKVE